MTAALAILLIGGSSAHAESDFKVSHEGPQLDRGPVPYSGYDADRGIELGMMVWVGRLRYDDTVPTGRRS